MQAMSAGSLVAVSSLREFFRDAFHAASEHQRLDIDEQAEQYVVNLLTMFSRAEALYEQTPEGLRIRPLAHMLADALEALEGIESVAVVRFTERDVVRHPLVARIVGAYEARDRASGKSK